MISDDVRAGDGSAEAFGAPAWISDRLHRIGPFVDNLCIHQTYAFCLLPISVVVH